jgi:D-alanyl-D-alanine carboxypeptidase
MHEQLLFRPLKLRHTYFAGHSQPLDPTPEPTVLRFEGSPLHIPLMMRSLRGMYSTAEDTLVFLRSFVRGEVFRDPATLASMQQRWNRFSFPLDRAALRSPGWPIEYGLGIMRFRLPRVFTPLHPMPSVLGHTGSTGCWLFYCPQLDMLLSGSVDEVTAGAVPYRVVPKILQVLRSSSRGTGGVSAANTIA